MLCKIFFKITRKKHHFCNTTKTLLCLWKVAVCCCGCCFFQIVRLPLVVLRVNTRGNHQKCSQCYKPLLMTLHAIRVKKIQFRNSVILENKQVPQDQLSELHKLKISILLNLSILKPSMWHNFSMQLNYDKYALSSQKSLICNCFLCNPLSYIKCFSLFCTYFALKCIAPLKICIWFWSISVNKWMNKFSDF